MLKSLLKPVTTGFSVLASEAKWVLIQSWKRWEIRQMEKRLRDEFCALGENVASCLANEKSFDPQTSANDLALKQIGFLQDEIAHLQEELANARAKYHARNANTAESEA